MLPRGSERNDKKKVGCGRRGKKVILGEIHPRNQISHMVGYHSDGKEELGKVAIMHGFQKPQQGMS